MWKSEEPLYLPPRRRRARALRRASRRRLAAGRRAPARATRRRTRARGHRPHRAGGAFVYLGRRPHHAGPRGRGRLAPARRASLQVQGPHGHALRPPRGAHRRWSAREGRGGIPARWRLSVSRFPFPAALRRAGTGNGKAIRKPARKAIEERAHAQTVTLRSPTTLRTSTSTGGSILTRPSFASAVTTSSGSPRASPTQ